MSIVAVIGSILTIIIGVWRFVARRNSQVRKEAETAKQQLKEGLDEKDTSKITASFDRVRRIRGRMRFK